MTTTTEIPLDERQVQAFAERVFDLYTGGMLALMIDLGNRTGLFDAAREAPGTSAEIAERAGLHERYVREWLGALVSARIVDYDPVTEVYRVPPEHAACLTGDGNDNLARFSEMNTHLAGHLDRVARAFRDGGGVPYDDFRPEFTDVMDRLSRSSFDETCSSTRTWPSPQSCVTPSGGEHGLRTLAAAPGTRSY